MNQPHPEPDLTQVLDEYLAAVQAGDAPDKEIWLSKYPHLADDLKECLASLEFIGQAAVAPPEDEAKASDWPSLEQPLGDFQIVREVGRGGMGVVYEAVQLSLGRRVALKVLPFAAILDPRQLQRFRLESQAAALLHHQNIVPIYQVGCERGIHFYAMQLVDGHSLDMVIRQLREARDTRQTGDLANPDPLESTLETQRPNWAESLLSSHRSYATRRENESHPSTVAGLHKPTPNATGPAVVDTPQSHLEEVAASSLDRSTGSTAPLAAVETEKWTKSASYMKTVAHLGIQAADALEHAHRQGVIHRDIKPSNLLLDGRGQLWITDFGLARLDTDDALTMTGDIVGTLRYMSPEQTTGNQSGIDHRSDIYSLGATLYEMLTLEPVFKGDSRHELLKRIAQSEPRSPRSVNPKIPAELALVVLKALGKMPGERYATAGELGQDLRRYLDDIPVRARRPSTAKRLFKWARRHRAAVASSLAFLFLLLTLVSIVSVRAALLLRKERNVARAAERESNRQLWNSHLERARAQRAGSLPGRRFDSWKAILDAVELGKRTELTESDVKRLRDEAIACLAISGDVESELEYDYPSFSWFTSFNDDLSLFARVSDEAGEITVYRTADQSQVAQFPPQGQVQGFMLSNDGQFLAVSLSSREVLLWNVATEQVITRLQQASHGAFDMNSSNELYGVATSQGKVLVGKLSDGSVISEIVLPSAPHVVRFGQNSEVLVTAGPFEIRAWDPRTAKRIWSVTADFPVANIKVYDNGQQMFVLSTDRRVYHWSAYRRDMVPFSHGAMEVLDIFLSGKSQLMALSTQAESTVLTTTQDSQELVRMPRRVSRFSRDGRRLSWNTSFSVGVDRIGISETLDFLDYQQQGTYFQPVFGNQGRWLASGCQDGVVIWEAATGRHLAHLTTGHTSALFFDAPTKTLIVGGTAGVFRWPVHEEGGNLRFGPPEEIDAALKFAYLSAGPKGVLASCFNGVATISGLAQGQGDPITLRHSLVNHVSVSPDQRHAVTGTRHGRGVLLWDLSTRKIVTDLWPQTGHAASAFSPDGKWLVIARGWAYRLYKVGSWDVIWELKQEGASDAPGSMAFSPDLRHIMIRRSSSEMNLVDLETGDVGVTFGNPHPYRGYVAAFSSCGRYLVESTSKRMIAKWDLRSTNEQLDKLGLAWNEPAAYPPSPATIVDVSVEYGNAYRLQRMAASGMQPSGHWLQNLIEQGLRWLKNDR